MIVNALEQLQVGCGVPCASLDEKLQSISELARKCPEVLHGMGHFKGMLTAVDCARLYFLRKILLCLRPTMATNTAEYQRKYRATVKPMNERKAHTDGVQDGLARCIKYLREKIGSRALTGHQAALMVERSMLDGEQNSVTARRQFVEALRGGQGEAR